MKTKLSTPSAPASRNLSRGGFINLRTLLGLTLGFSALALALFAHFSPLTSHVSLRDTAKSDPPPYMPVPGNSSQEEALGLSRLEQFWHDRLTFPTGRFDPAWVRAAAAQHAQMTSGVPAGHFKLDLANPN